MKRIRCSDSGARRAIMTTAIAKGLRSSAAPSNGCAKRWAFATSSRSEEHTSELQSLMRISYAVFCLKKKNKQYKKTIRKLNTRQTKHITHENHESYIKLKTN